MILSNVRPWGADAVDVVMAGGRVVEVVPAGTAATAGERTDGGGLLALPGFVNAHAHVDKSWWGRPTVQLATNRAAGFVHRDRHDLVPGARADVVLLDAENVPDALVRVPRRRLVLAGGRLVAQDGELVRDI